MKKKDKHTLFFNFSIIIFAEVTAAVRNKKRASAPYTINTGDAHKSNTLGECVNNIIKFLSLSLSRCRSSKWAISANIYGWMKLKPKNCTHKKDKYIYSRRMYPALHTECERVPGERGKLWSEIQKW